MPMACAARPASIGAQRTSRGEATPVFIACAGRGGADLRGKGNGYELEAALGWLEQGHETCAASQR
jgi:hypothetical protein